MIKSWDGQSSKNIRELLENSLLGFTNEDKVLRTLYLQFFSFALANSKKYHLDYVLKNATLGISPDMFSFSAEKVLTKTSSKLHAQLLFDCIFSCLYTSLCRFAFGCVICCFSATISVLCVFQTLENFFSQ